MFYSLFYPANLELISVQGPALTAELEIEPEMFLK